MTTLIIGLGNPGKEYEKTYHNAGFLALQHLARDAGKNWKRGADSWEYLKLGKSILVRPLTFMNNSGQAVKSALAYFKVLPQNLLVIHDDSDLPLGKYKLVFGRGSAGHKGVESIQKALKTKEFSRLRLGIRPEVKGVGLPPEGRREKAETFVLKKMSSADLKKLYGALEETKLNLTEN